MRVVCKLCPRPTGLRVHCHSLHTTGGIITCPKRVAMSSTTRKATGESRGSIACISLPPVHLKRISVRVVGCPWRGRFQRRTALPGCLHQFVLGETERLLLAASVEQDAPRLDVHQPCLLNTIANLIHGLHALLGQIRNDGILMTLRTVTDPASCKGNGGVCWG